MIKPKDRDMNRSRDVAGPKLERSYDQETTMKDKMMKDDVKGDVFHDSAPTGTIEKTPLESLHEGDVEVPLTATGRQKVVITVPMGQDHADHTPVTSKGPTKDQSHHGGEGKTSYSEKTKSE